MRVLLLLTILTTALLSGCGYNTLQSQDEQVKAAWSQVLNQYQKRADLVPNLVNVVKGAAAQERQVLDDVVQARSRVGSIQATPELINDEAAFKKFQAAQADLTSALSRLLAVAENYPNLKSIDAFRDLQVQLEGIENRIAVERKRYIDSVRTYNTTVRSFPTNLTVANEDVISKPPTVDFGTTAPAPAPAPAPQGN